jgi:dynein heavy chain
MRNHESKLPLPNCDGDDTIFEFVVNEQGQWEHWRERVSRDFLASNYQVVFVLILTKKQY